MTKNVAEVMLCWALRNWQLLLLPLGTLALGSLPPHSEKAPAAMWTGASSRHQLAVMMESAPSRMGPLDPTDT